MSLPKNVTTSLSELAKLSDDIWYLAGDTSVDTSWYTKRAAICAIYASTELAMAQDKSPGFSATWGFLDRRLCDMQKLDKVASEMGDYMSFTTFAFMNILRSKNIVR